MSTPVAAAACTTVQRTVVNVHKHHIAGSGSVVRLAIVQVCNEFCMSLLLTLAMFAGTAVESMGPDRRHPEAIRNGYKPY